jgi:glycine cleavage system H protein
VESVKAVSELFSPVSGEVLEINSQIADSPEDINFDPYGKGWLIKVLLANPGETSRLISAKDYDDYTAEET